jgi:hypothetical protein
LRKLYEEFYNLYTGAGVAQSVQRPAIDWTTEGSEFDSR